ncbi:endoplasmic reticulum membrane-associated RNA degradation protein isoform X2 [Engystomops pustulosus]|uniref:endoplasmic reticulum membrane-associated RNA degradation protein isoform X2 n=1 Tax=Engystomops pustulosus TaxID=76066 RepID=UPI003AFAA972
MRFLTKLRIRRKVFLNLDLHQKSSFFVALEQTKTNQRIRGDLPGDKASGIVPGEEKTSHSCSVPQTNQKRSNDARVGGRLKDFLPQWKNIKNNRQSSGSLTHHLWEQVSTLQKLEVVCPVPPEEKGEELDYLESVRKLGPLCGAVHAHFMSLANEKYVEAFNNWFQWTNNSEVYLIIGKDCPFLLRDLLTSQELASIFSQPVMNVLKIFLGSPKSLNLRNILWHGFVSPNEIPPKYCSMLLLFTAGLGQLLQSWLTKTKMSLVHRPYFVFSSLHEIKVCPDLNEKMLLLAESFMEKSKFVLPHMVPFWIESFNAFRQGRYADCATVLLPQLETGLRLAFTTVNDCPQRMLTAESTTLYTTFDEILAKNLNDGSPNRLPATLGESVMEFLWDILNHREGPRVRDHLGHGEIQLLEFPKLLATALLGFSIFLLYRQLQQDSLHKEDFAVVHPIIAAAESYCSRFHPIALVQKQVFQCCESLEKWNFLPISCLDFFNETREHQDHVVTALSFYSEVDHIISLLHCEGKACFTAENCSNWLQTDKWFLSTKDLCRKHISNLYCPRLVLEAVSVLHKVSTQCHQVSNNIISISELRYEQWQNKILRSRQRHNYQRLLCSIRSLSTILRLIITIVIMDLHNIHLCTSEKTHLEYQKYLKYLKTILQYTENMSTCTSPEKNRWDEAIQMTSRIILKIKTFNEKNKAI